MKLPAYWRTLKKRHKRGWGDACDAISKAAGDVKAGHPSLKLYQAYVITAEPRKTGRPSSNTIEVVEDCINASPGKKGVEVVKAAQLVDLSINERTVRTCLRRLKLNKKIWQRNGLWYPKPPRSALGSKR